MSFLRWRIRRREALQQCRFIPLVCAACGSITEIETPSSEEILEEFLDLVPELREYQEEWSLHERARILFDRFPESLHPARVRGPSLILPNGSKGESDPEFEAVMRQDAELAEWLCPSQGSNSGYNPKGQAMIAEYISLYEKM